MRGTIAITGASGFLGTELCRVFLDAGWTVRAGVRRRVRAPEGAEPFTCNLPTQFDARALRGADVCIHAAYTTQFRTLREARRVNVGGTLALLRACRVANVPRLVFVSSCSAHENARSFYGRSKFALEREFDPARDLVVRPGLLTGPGGLFARMVESVQRLPVVPLFDGGRQPLQTIPVHVAAEGIRMAVEQGLHGRVVLAEPRPIEMRDFFRLIAEALRSQPRDHVGSSRIEPRFLTVPSLPVLAVLRAVERVGVRLPVSSENLLGLRGAVFQPSRGDLMRLRLAVPPADYSVYQAVTRLFDRG